MPFTPINTLVGGALLHVSTSSLLADTGRVLGISGILESGIFGVEAKWQRAVLLGLLLGPALGSLAGLEDVYAGDALRGWAGISAGRAAIAGLLVGFGSRLGSGCTSGHFLCGVSRGSKRSLVATATFFSAALITANLTFTQSTWLKPAYSPEYPSHRGRITLFLTFAALRLGHSTLQHCLSGVKAPTTTQRYATYLLPGLTFSIGLLVSGMADPRKVLSFLTISHLPSFDPSLAMVVLSGVVPNAVHWYNTQKGKTRLSWETWSVPSRQDIDYRLIIGSALFGIGWGLAGVCPGPALVGLGQTAVSAIQGQAVVPFARGIASFVGAMVAGMALVKQL